MEIRCLQSEQELEALEPSWNRLAGGHVFRRFEWAAAWWQAWQNSERRLMVLIAEEHGLLRAIAPLVWEQSLLRGKTLSLLGGGVACGDDLSLLTETSDWKPAIVAIAEWLAQRQRQGGWDTIAIDGVAADDPRVSLLSDQLTAAGATTAVRSDASTWSMHLPASWDAYAAQRGKGTRRVLRQALKTLRASHHEIEVRWPQRTAALWPYFDALVELHGKRWQGERGGSFATEGFASFLREAAQRWWAEEKLGLFVLYVRDQPAAAAIGVSHHDAFSAYLLGRDPQFDACKPGWMLNAWMIERAIEMRLGRFDFLRGDEPYKAQLGCTPTPQVKIQITGAGILNQLRSASATLHAVAHRMRHGDC